MESINSRRKFITYKGIVFNIRPDALGISKQLQEMISEHNHQEYIQQKPYLSQPEFMVIANVEAAITEIYKDKEKNLELLEAAETEEKKKEIEEVIAKNDAHIAEQWKQLQSPEVLSVYVLLSQDKRLYDEAYKSNPDNIFALAKIFIERKPIDPANLSEVENKFIELDKLNDKFRELNASFKNKQTSMLEFQINEVVENISKIEREIYFLQTGINLNEKDDDYMKLAEELFDVYFFTKQDALTAIKNIKKDTHIVSAAK